MDLTWDDAAESPPIVDTGEPALDVPVELAELPDGSPTAVYGDVDGYADFCRKQGDNAYGFEGTCGLASSADVLNQFGFDTSESEVVDHAVARNECSITDDPESSGGTTADGRATLLTEFGLPSHVEQGQSLEDLAADVEQGHGVIITANAGYLWNDANHVEDGGGNHAVTVTGVARDPETGAVQGFYMNDSGTGNAAQFVNAQTMTQAWLGAGGEEVVTDAVHSAPEETL